MPQLLVNSSPAFANYLLSGITVKQYGVGCAGAVDPTGRPDASGIPVEFACPDRIETVDVSVRMLTDIDPRYQILGIGPDGQRAVYDAEHAWHTRRLGVGPSGEIHNRGRGALIQIGAVLATTLVLAGGVWWRLQRRTTAAAGP